MPIFFKKFTAISNLGLSFLFISPKFLNFEMPFALDAAKKITKNSSIAELFKFFGQLIPFRFVELLTSISEIISPLYFFLFFRIIFAFILFKIFIIPNLDLFTFIFFTISFDFFDSKVKTMKKALELISPGTLYSNPSKLCWPFTSIKSKFFFEVIFIGTPRFFKISSVWFLDFFAFILVLPLAFKAASITALLHCALPRFSIYFIGLKKFDPRIFTGKLLFLELNTAPNCFSGSVTRRKSRVERLLSPIIVIWFFESTSNPKINLAKVPEFPAFKTTFFSVLNPCNPNPSIS